MSKKSLLFITTVGILIFLFGCAFSAYRNTGTISPRSTGPGELVLNLDSKSVSNRTIQPDIDMTVSSYDIYGYGPDGATFEELNIIASSITISGLAPGNWLITVDAKNEDGAIIGDGSTNVLIVSGNTASATVEVAPLDGIGELLITVTWENSDKFTDPVVTGTLTPTGGTPENIGFFTNGNQATHNSTRNKGYYIISIHAEEDGETWNFVDSLRIVYNETTQALIDVTGPTADGVIIITIDDDLQNPIEITFTGDKSQLEEGTNMNITASTDPSPVDCYQWYLDGAKLDGEINSSIIIGDTLPLGFHKLTLFVELGTILSAKHILFEVVEDISAQNLPDELLDDFNDEDFEHNLWNGEFENFVTNLGEETLSISYDTINKMGDSGYGFKIDYDLPEDTSFGGVKIKLSSDGSRKNLGIYEYLNFWVKGSVDDIPLKIEFQTTDFSLTDPVARSKAALYVSDYLDGGITTDWQEVKIPLDAFANLDSLNSLSALLLEFEHDYAVTCGYPTTGEVYIDNIGFGEASLGIVRIDHFSDKWGWMAIGGNLGSMPNELPALPWHKATFDDTVYHNYPSSLKSEYDVSEPEEWAGFFMLLGGGGDGWEAVKCDFSGYSDLTFWAKAESEAKNPKIFKLEVNYLDEKFEWLSTGLNDTWQKWRISLYDPLWDHIDWSKVTQINIVYEKSSISSESGAINGTVYFDEFQFE